MQDLAIKVQCLGSEFTAYDMDLGWGLGFASTGAFMLDDSRFRL